MFKRVDKTRYIFCNMFTHEKVIHLSIDDLDNPDKFAHSSHQTTIKEQYEAEHCTNAVHSFATSLYKHNYMIGNCRFSTTVYTYNLTDNPISIVSYYSKMCDMDNVYNIHVFKTYEDHDTISTNSLFDKKITNFGESNNFTNEIERYPIFYTNNYMHLIKSVLNILVHSGIDFNVWAQSVYMFVDNVCVLHLHQGSDEHENVFIMFETKSTQSILSKKKKEPKQQVICKSTTLALLTLSACLVCHLVRVCKK